MGQIEPKSCKIDINKTRYKDTLTAQNEKIMDPMTIAAIGSTAINLGTAIYGKRKQAKEQRKYNQFLDSQQSKLDGWYAKEKATKYLDTADGQHIYQGMKRMLKENNNRVDNTLVKTGATAESSIAAKQQAQDSLASTASELASKDTAMKQDLNTQYQTQAGTLRSLRIGNMQSAIDGAKNTGDNAMGAMGGSLTSLFSSIGQGKGKV